jgi:hypothetical protein
VYDIDLGMDLGFLQAKVQDAAFALFAGVGLKLNDPDGRVWVDRPAASLGSPTLTLRDYHGDRIAANVDFAEDGLLVHSMILVSGWKAFICLLIS